MSQEKCFEPSKKKLQKAKKEGKVGYAKELVVFIQLSICIYSIKYITLNWHVILDLYHKIFIYNEHFYVVINDYIWLYMVKTCAIVLVAFLGVIWIATVATECAQKGFICSWGKIKPSLSAISPQAGIKRMFHQQNGETFHLKNLLFEYVLLCILCFACGGLLCSFMYDYFVAAIHADIDDIYYISHIGALIAQSFLLKVLCISCIFGIIRFLKSKRDIHQELKMTIEEYRKELKEDEGDPHLANERKAIHREISLHGVLENAKKASVVITD